MRTLRIKMAALAGLALSTAWAVCADEAAEPGGAPSNLQVLPGHLSRASVRSLMKQYERALGVSCNYCHVEDRDSGFIDYASDENPRKHTARLMIAMLEDINDRHLVQLGGDRRYAQPVTCGSCHQGRATPQAFEP
jgi:hypothetical protein